MICDVMKEKKARLPVIRVTAVILIIIFLFEKKIIQVYNLFIVLFGMVLT